MGIASSWGSESTLRSAALKVEDLPCRMGEAFAGGRVKGIVSRAVFQFTGGGGISAAFGRSIHSDHECWTVGMGEGLFYRRHGINPAREGGKRAGSVGREAAEF